jgi:L-aminopeptidase/D-esterase-like protein
MELDSGVSVAAAVVVNAAGSLVNPANGRLWADRRQLLATPGEDEREVLATTYVEAQRPPATTIGTATTIGVVMTDATLTKAQASKVAAVAHDGMARAIRPVHSLFDGDTIFCLASSHRHRPVAEDHIRSLFAFNALLAAAADVFADACLDGILAATGRGAWQSYTELAPSVAG